MSKANAVPLETKDPWKGEEMRLPIGIMASIEMPKDEDSALVQGWKSFVTEALERSTKHATAH